MKIGDHYRDDNKGNTLRKIIEEAKREQPAKKQEAPEGKIAWGDGLGKLIEEAKAKLDERNKKNPPTPSDDKHESSMYKVVKEAKAELAIKDFRQGIQKTFADIAKKYSQLFTGEYEENGLPIFKPEFEKRADEILQAYSTPSADGKGHHNPILESADGIHQLLDHLASGGE